MPATHAEIIKQYLDNKPIDTNRLRELWKMPETKLSVHDFNIARQIRFFEPLPWGWEATFRLHDKVELLVPEPDYNLPLWFQGQRTTGIIDKIASPDDAMAAKGRPIQVKLDIRYMAIPLPEIMKDFLRRSLVDGKKLSEEEISQAIYETIYVYFHPNWLSKVQISEQA
jgi:hypothetical protein